MALSTVTPASSGPCFDVMRVLVITWTGRCIGSTILVMVLLIAIFSLFPDQGR